MEALTAHIDKKNRDPRLVHNNYLFDHQDKQRFISAEPQLVHEMRKVGAADLLEATYFTFAASSDGHFMRPGFTPIPNSPGKYQLAFKPSLEDQLAVAISEAHEAQQDHQRVALAAVEKRATAKELDKAAEALRQVNARVSTLRAASVAAAERENKEAADAAAAKEAAERAEIAGALSVLRQVAAEWDNAVDALVEVAQQFDSASRELYAKSPSTPESYRRTKERGRLRWKPLPSGLRSSPAGLHSSRRVLGPPD
jgi:hypothetical protein